MVEKIIEIPNDVKIEVKEREVVVKGPKGELSRDFNDPRFNKKVSIEKKDDKIIVSSEINRRKINAIVGTFAAIIRNMIIGVTKGFKCTLTIHTVHFPINVEVKDNKVHIKNFLGERGERVAKIIGNVDVKVEKDKIILTGINKEDVGQTASNIEGACRISKRDRRIFQDGIYITEKVSPIENE